MLTYTNRSIYLCLKVLQRKVPWCQINDLSRLQTEYDLCGTASRKSLSTHWVTHICFGKLAIIGSDNGLSLGLRQASIYTNPGISTEPLETNFSEIRIKIQILSFAKFSWKCRLPKCGPLCPGGDELTHWGRDNMATIFQTTFSNAFSWMKNVWISNEISLKFVPMGLITNILALNQIMAWRRPGDKPLSEPMMVSLLTHICVTRPQWVKTPSCTPDTYGMPLGSIHVILVLRCMYKLNKAMNVV